MKSYLSVLILVLSASSVGQILLGPGLVQSGPFGRPVLIKNDADQWVTPLMVYKNSDVEISTVDVTQTGWVQWSVERFRKTGKFEVPIYSYFLTDRGCRTTLVVGHDKDPNVIQACKHLRYRVEQSSIDTRNNDAVAILHLFVIRKDGIGTVAGPIDSESLSSHSQPLQIAIRRISALVEKEMSEFHGMSVEDVIRQDAQTTLKMMNSIGLHPDTPPSPQSPAPPPVVVEPVVDEAIVVQQKKKLPCAELIAGVPPDFVAPKMRRWIDLGCPPDQNPYSNMKKKRK
jgi:hypothetical protein